MALTLGEYSQSKERLIAPTFQHCRTRLKQAQSRLSPKACTAPSSKLYSSGSLLLYSPSYSYWRSQYWTQLFNMKDDEDAKL